MQDYLKYRTYHGATLSNTAQEASIVAWNDEAHVAENRAHYRAKFEAVLEILGPAMGATPPDAGFYLWPEVPISDEDFARGLFAGENVTVLPGSYLSREAQGINPGHQHVRMALVAPLDECIDAAQRVQHYMETIS
jgi:N-succinyldiaminopimelate aminotransferase